MPDLVESKDTLLAVVEAARHGLLDVVTQLRKEIETASKNVTADIEDILLSTVDHVFDHLSKLTVTVSVGVKK